MNKVTRVYGVGINDADYPVVLREELPKLNGKRKRKITWACPYYAKWASMLQRAVCQKFKEKHPTYKEVTVCEEWLTFSNFKSWMEQQDWEGKELDKDLINPEYKSYSPQTCVFVDRRINIFLVGRDSCRGDLPIGVSLRSSKRSKPYTAKVNNPFTNKYEYIGDFLTAKQAHEAWRKRKHELALLLADTQTDPRIIHALRTRHLAC